MQILVIFLIWVHVFGKVSLVHVSALCQAVKLFSGNLYGYVGVANEAFI